MPYATLGSMIRYLRKQSNMTQAVLAQKVGVTDKAVSKWERELSYPDISLFPRLADVLGVTADDLLREFIDEEKPSRLLQIFKMSHDLRTPLHIILGYAKMAELHCEEPEKLTKYLAGIRVSGEYLLKVLDYVLDVSHLDDRMDFEGSLVELSDYLANNYPNQVSNLEKFDFSGKRILLVDDMEVNREIAAEMVMLTGADVDYAENGQICVDKVTEADAGYYDLILMDLQMPVMDGIEAVKRIRQLPDEKKASVPIIAMTANVYKEDRHAAFEAGMNAFVEKPIVMEVLFNNMKDYLE
ncbi:MAG: response regulator [Lachnospiraceae bacterium]|nr:response regulator [Lachnospiraceae bacterium]